MREAERNCAVNACQRPRDSSLSSQAPRKGRIFEQDTVSMSARDPVQLPGGVDSLGMASMMAPDDSSHFYRRTFPLSFSV
jgi:hypothetical protein